jgi:hypothetical protein
MDAVWGLGMTWWLASAHGRKPLNSSLSMVGLNPANVV